MENYPNRLRYVFTEGNAFQQKTQFIPPRTDRDDSYINKDTSVKLQPPRPSPNLYSHNLSIILGNLQNGKTNDHSTEKESDNLQSQIHANDLYTNKYVSGTVQFCDSSYSCHRKFFWGCAIFFCLAGFFYQQFILIKIFLSYPTVVDIKILRNESITFPAITFCPSKLAFDINNSAQFFVSDWCYEFYDPYKCSLDLFTQIAKFNFSVEAMWNHFRVESTELHVEAPCISASDDECLSGTAQFPMEASYVKTMYGTCLTYSPKKPVLFRGPDTFIGFYYKHLPTLETRFLHEDDRDMYFHNASGNGNPSDNGNASDNGNFLLLLPTMAAPNAMSLSTNMRQLTDLNVIYQIS